MKTIFLLTCSLLASCSIIALSPRPDLAYTGSKRHDLIPMKGQGNLLMLRGSFVAFFWAISGQFLGRSRAISGPFPEIKVSICKYMSDPEMVQKWPVNGPEMAKKWPVNDP